MAGILPGRAGSIFNGISRGKEIEMEKRSFKGIICAAVIAALGVVGSGCDDDPIVEDAEFDAIDTNADGLVSAAEWNTAFDAWDVDGDGFVDSDEYLLDDGFNSLDVDSNALLTDAEWNGAMGAWDLDGDGFLDPDEMFF
jgi:hypothetical protein